MQIALLSVAALSSIVVAAGTLLAWHAMRTAPQGMQDSLGFHAVNTEGTLEQFPTQAVGLKRAA